MRIIAYTYEADVHCPACSRSRFWRHRLSHKPAAPHDYDRNGIDIKQVDREGNPIHPVFDIDEHDFTHCGTCREELDT